MKYFLRNTKKEHYRKRSKNENQDVSVTKPGFLKNLFSNFKNDFKKHIAEDKRSLREAGVDVESLGKEVNKITKKYGTSLEKKLKHRAELQTNLVGKLKELKDLDKKIRDIIEKNMA